MRCDVSQIMASTIVHIRVDQKTKQRAAKNLATMSLSVSDAANISNMRTGAKRGKAGVIERY